MRLDPNDAWPYLSRGDAYAKMGRETRAVNDWKRAVLLDWRMITGVYYRQYSRKDARLDQIMATAALDHLEDVTRVDGRESGWGMAPGEFYTVLLILADHLPEEEFLRMVDHEKPVVRAMGLIYLAKKDIVRHQAIIESFYDDTAEIDYIPYGCLCGPISLARLAENIMEDPSVLRYWTPEESKPLSYGESE